ncbi:tetratricopeptide repeat protein [Mucilaginibacter sp. CSA2-8R]|uniref:tetratricopeptide repeat protein n=1 Tax=Mucilaginibacter sp. CSA2-8R TaxID=3141542 RepID=UPI00315DE6B2
MKKLITCLILVISAISSYAIGANYYGKQDTTEVIDLTIRGFDMRMTDPSQALKYADRALNLAKKLGYEKGEADALRLRGLAESYLGNSQKAIESFSFALDVYKNLFNVLGEVRIYLNISSLYQNVDYDQCISYLDSAMNLYHSRRLDNKTILASIYLNYGNVYQLQKSYTKSFVNYHKSYDIIKELNESDLLGVVLTNLGIIESITGHPDRAKSYLYDALKTAKEHEYNQLIAQINLTLASIFTEQNDFDKAEKSLEEGKAYAELIDNASILQIYRMNSYRLELKRKNFEKALRHLQDIYRIDSIQYSTRNSAELSLFQANYRKDKLSQEKNAMLMRQKYDRNKFISTIVLAACLIVVILLLVNNVKRKAETNKMLTDLNAEISTQKDNLDKINHYLEEIIDDRTKDLQLKNKKLSDYSSHLSHQVRGPIATLKGLMNLEQEGLVSQEECIQLMIKCVSEIDDKILDMSDMLHNPERSNL